MGNMIGAIVFVGAVVVGSLIAVTPQLTGSASWDSLSNVRPRRAEHIHEWQGPYLVHTNTQYYY